MEGTKCGVGVMAVNSNLYILGDTFMRNFYTSFDFQQLTVSMAPTSNPPTTTHRMDTYKILGIVFICVAGLAALGGVATCVYKKKCCFQKSPEEIVY